MTVTVPATSSWVAARTVTSLRPTFPPSDAGELEPGKVYRGAVLSWESKGDDGITPTGLSFTYDVGSAGLDDVDDILWN